MRDKMSDEERVTGTPKPEGNAPQSGVLVATSINVPDVVRAEEAMKAFGQLKKKLLEDGDIATINGVEVMKRSGFSKMALAFNISTEGPKITRIVTKDDYIAHATARAIAPNGRFAEGTGSCAKSEFAGGMPATIHNIESKAATRATNRAIANLIGGAILSEDELPADQHNFTAPKPAMPSPTAITNPDSPASDKQKEFIEALCGKAFGKEKQLDGLLTVLTQQANGHVLGELTKGEANKVIEYLKTLPVHK